LPASTPGFTMWEGKRKYFIGSLYINVREMKKGKKEL
jgi:hypothetical protein